MTSLSSFPVVVTTDFFGVEVLDFAFWEDLDLLEVEKSDLKGRSACLKVRRTAKMPPGSRMVRQSSIQVEI